MKFFVSRTSNAFSKPCDNAKQVFVKHKDVDKDGNSFMVGCWQIVIKDLRELQEFQKKVGDIIISTSPIDGKTPEIEIYDDDRE